MTPNELVALFLSGRSPKTLAAYRSDLQDFADFVGVLLVDDAAQHILSLAHGDANALSLRWRAGLVTRGLAPATINRRLSALRALVMLGRSVGLIQWSLDLPSVRSAAYRDTRGPKRGDIVRLMDFSSRQPDHRKAARDVAMLRLLYDLALRRGEVCQLDLIDFDVDGGRVMVLGKGRREKMPVSLPSATIQAITGWIKVRGNTPGPLFRPIDLATEKNPTARLTGPGLWYIVQSLGAAIGIKLRPHGLRHSAITTALDRTNGNLRTVQRFSRHVDIRVLELYDDARRDDAGGVATLVAL